MQLIGKTILLTGANSRAGRYVSTLLQGLGAELIRLGSDKNSAFLINTNNSERVSATRSLLYEKDIDVLINLDELFYFGYLSDQSHNELNNIVMANVTTPIQLAQAVIPNMLKKRKA